MAIQAAQINLANLELGVETGSVIIKKENNKIDPLEI